MQISIIDIIFLIIGAGVLWTLFKFNSRPAEDEPLPDLISLPYEKNDTLLTDTEVKFFHELQTVVGDQYIVFSKVRVFDVINVKKGMDKGDTRLFEDRIKKESVDFVLCTPMNTKAVIALELEDIMDRSDARAERDKFIDRVFSDAKFPLLRFKVRGSYSNEIKAQLQQAIQFREKTEEEAAS